MEGTVKWYSVMKAYGFIEVEDEKDVFVHQSAMPDNMVLYEGDNVSFEIEQGDKGPHAANIQKL
jgi:CspA family cold shock protein